MDAKTEIMQVFICNGWVVAERTRGGIAPSIPLETVADKLAPLLSGGVDVKKLVMDLQKQLWEHHRMMSTGLTEEFTEIIQSALSDSSAELAQIKWICDTIDEFGHTMDYDSEMATLAGRVNGTFAEKDTEIERLKAERLAFATESEERQQEIERLRASKDTAYAERNKMVAFLSCLYPSHLKRHPESDTEWEDDWRNIVCVHGPAGQMTWHIHDSECHLYQHLNVKPDLFAECEYDGHTTDEKYQRLFSCVAIAALSGGEKEGDSDGQG